VVAFILAVFFLYSYWHCTFVFL